LRAWQSFHPKINIVSVPGSVGARGDRFHRDGPLERQEISEHFDTILAL
jgi:hypothetical protein